MIGFSSMKKTPSLFPYVPKVILWCLYSKSNCINELLQSIYFYNIRKAFGKIKNVQLKQLWTYLSVSIMLSFCFEFKTENSITAIYNRCYNFQLPLQLKKYLTIELSVLPSDKKILVSLILIKLSENYAISLLIKYLIPFLSRLSPVNTQLICKKKQSCLKCIYEF